MFKQVFRVAFVTLIWKQYKGSIISTLLLIAYLLIVSNVHQDYLLASGDDAEKITFVYKWLAYLAGIILVCTYHWIKTKFSQNDDETSEGNTKAQIEKYRAMENTSDDPFAEIRAREKLRSRADFLMEKKDKD